ncbi:aa3-type cytochrome c oxidase subunit IV [Marivivens donghaensis]|uniref:Aa3-type cytochrome c oxidase subunit IV n=1 Tax=Marivivens donghaensis TaxID=1699413 RepID=A0ABX0W0E5_9RHOB|nr:aa3-type cytochrome c oxidase subunit IV [Marivivens donghaensis]NIY73564.1 aa3-type cytochrome c oxidase subunit IV [Marivivens donghaensis]
MAEHEHGTMDYSAQEKTYNGFVKFATRTGIVIIVALIVLTLVNG